MLVQEKVFKKVELFFLIVGHTHASIDQYFSVLSRLILKTNFIGSPLALENLLLTHNVDRQLSGIAWTSEENRKAFPLLVKKISVVYDMKKALSPFINHQIRFYSIPHMFRFELFHGVCAMQYALFSTHSTLLPRRPERDGSTPGKSLSSMVIL